MTISPLTRPASAPLHPEASRPSAAQWGRLADDMAARARQVGENPIAEEYLECHPELWQQPEAALELIATAEELAAPA